MVVLGHDARTLMTRDRGRRRIGGGVDERLVEEVAGEGRRPRRWWFSWVTGYFDLLVEGGKGVDLLDGDVDCGGGLFAVA